ncbi:unnamed protein product [Musa acuminata subsp. malaccensis]|uniref:(wild Malaysian banana) hypothetical protein n=1 Tax=Musa acuminata subsp. malaccensis TaxID=214687 RepID=A0A8D7AHS4_MUSAM|nr:unnamed protein product [Musa acuminata subsp. malaccensis]
MGFLRSAPPPVCLSSRHCSHWARIYLKYCLCSVKDGMALFLGTISIISWGIAEVPQIITNYRQKSTEGLSIAFLLTWVVGDLFNFIGCLLEPATLPTQYYVALLYTATTLILTGQTIYYGHIYHRFKANCGVPGRIEIIKKIGIGTYGSNSYISNEIYHFGYVLEDASERESLLGDAKKTRVVGDRGHDAKEGNLPSSPIPVAGQVFHDSCGKDFYYMSARSLKKSPVPTFGFWSVHSHDDGRAPPIDGNQQSPQSAPSNLDTKNMFSIVPSVAFFFGICVIRSYISNMHTASSPGGMVILVGRKLLQVILDKVQDDGSSGVGTLLGWAMAAIYMGGRLPQICLNVCMNSGLNPLMFIFALTGNATYVGSILVNSLEWSKLRPNLPWLVDAGGCVILDAFILIQFAYFHIRESNKRESEDNPV